MSPTSTKTRSANGVSQPQNGSDLKEVLTDDVFRRMISLERKRSERTQRPFVLLLMDTGRAQCRRKRMAGFCSTFFPRYKPPRAKPTSWVGTRRILPWE